MEQKPAITPEEKFGSWRCGKIYPYCKYRGANLQLYSATMCQLLEIWVSFRYSVTSGPIFSKDVDGQITNRPLAKADFQ